VSIAPGHASQQAADQLLVPNNGSDVTAAKRRR